MIAVTQSPVKKPSTDAGVRNSQKSKIIITEWKGDPLKTVQKKKV